MYREKSLGSLCSFMPTRACTIQFSLVNWVLGAMKAFSLLHIEVWGCDTSL